MVQASHNLIVVVDVVEWAIKPPSPAHHRERRGGREKEGGGREKGGVMNREGGRRIRRVQYARPNDPPNTSAKDT